MRFLFLVVALTAPLTACGTSDPVLDEKLITIQTPSFTLQPGEEKFYCLYTTLPVDQDSGVHRVASHMTPGSHHMIVFKTKTQLEADGTFKECSNFGAGDNMSNIPVWLYASQTPDNEVVMPENVGIALTAHQPVIINMHYVNTTDAPMTAQVNIEMERYAPTFHFTEAHAFITFNTKINVPAGGTGSAGGTCQIDPIWNFVMMSTHSHQYTTAAKVYDGSSMVLETLDWAHATVARFEQPYYNFASGNVTYQCDYHNTTNMPLTTGESAISNEMCMAVGLFFPATRDTFCLNSLTVSF